MSNHEYTLQRSKAVLFLHVHVVQKVKLYEAVKPHASMHASFKVWFAIECNVWIQPKQE